MKIIIVDTDLDLCKELQKGFKEEGFAVDILHHGLEAWQRLVMHHGDYDIAILDEKLPGKSGLEICSDLREINVHLPILFFTNNDDTEHKIRTFNIGADDYVTKPITVRELIARVRAHLRRPQPTINPKLKIDALVLDPTTHTVTFENKKITLTLKEFSILEYLMRTPNEVVLRDRLLDHVWDFNFSGWSNIIDVHINNLRKKLGKAGKMIETIRGLGYKIKV